MKKSLITLALATVPALVLSACNGGSSGTSAGGPLPNTASVQSHGHVRPLDNGPQDLHAGGADFPGFAYNLDSQPVGLYNQTQPGPAIGSLFYAVPTKGTIYYCITGSTYGRAEFIANNGTATTACAALGQAATGFGARQDPLDFVASSVALKSSEYTTYKANRESGSVNWGEPFEFPQIGGPIVFPFRPKDFVVSQIKLSTWTYCAIANGTVSDWNDGAITADNGGTSVTGGVSQAITFFFRADGGGTTFATTDHLNTACNVSFKAPYNKAPYGSPSRSAAWTFGVGNSWAGPGSSGDPNPNFIGEQGDPGIVSAVQSTAFSTGYVTGAYVKAATNPGLGQALLQNGLNKSNLPVFTDPTVKKQVVGALKRVTARAITYGEGSDGQPLGTSAPWCVLYVNPTNYVNPPKGTYPLVTISYLLFYGNNNGVHTADKKTLVKWLQGKVANNTTNRLEYTPLSLGIQSAVLTALNGNGGSQPACIQ